MDFCLELCHEFKDFTDDGEGFLTTSECERIVFMALEHIKPHEDGTVPGYTDVKLYRNRATSKFVYLPDCWCTVRLPFVFFVFQSIFSFLQ